MEEPEHADPREGLEARIGQSRHLHEDARISDSDTRRRHVTRTGELDTRLDFVNNRLGYYIGIYGQDMRRGRAAGTCSTTVPAWYQFHGLRRAAARAPRNRVTYLRRGGRMATRGRRRRGPSRRGALGHPEPAQPGRYTTLPADTHGARRGGRGGRPRECACGRRT